jgi:hypothetical protein
VLLLDAKDEVYANYKIDDYRPQYIVIDKDMTVVFKSSQPPSRAEAQQFVESILD